MRLSVGKQVCVALLAVAACGIAAWAMKTWAPGALGLVYPCIAASSVVLGVSNSVCAIRGRRGDANRMVTPLAWFAVLSVLFCAVAGDLYGSGLSGLFGFGGPGVCLVVVAVSSTLSLCVSAGAWYLRCGGGRDSRQEGGSWPSATHASAAGPSTATSETGGAEGGGTLAGGVAKGRPETASGADSRKDNLGFFVIACVLFVAVFLLNVGGFGMWKDPDQSSAVAFVKTGLFSLLGVVCVIVSVGIASWVCVMTFNVVRSSGASARGEGGEADRTSFLVCALILFVAYAFLWNLDYEDFLSKFGGTDAFVPFVACVVFAALFAVLYNVVRFILKNATGGADLAKTVAVGFGSKLFLWIAEMLNWMIDSVGATPDFLRTVVNGIEDEEANRWYEEQCLPGEGEFDEGGEGDGWR